MENRIASRVGFALVAMAFCSAAQALSFRAYLSVDGSDSNPCNVQQPCRLLPAALDAVIDGGEVWMLDSANFNVGTVTIAKSVSILAVPGAVGSVVALGGPALSITASGLTVSLRNLVIVPFPASGGTDGVNLSRASTLTIEDSLLASLPGHAVNAAGAGKLKVTNTVIRNNAGYAALLANGVAATISGTQMLANTLGGVRVVGNLSSTTTVSVTDSVISGTGGGGSGVSANTSLASAVARAFVTRCTIQDNFSALAAETSGGLGSATVAISYNMIANNGVAWIQSGTGSVIRTLGNNHITDNTGGNTGVLTATALQ